MSLLEGFEEDRGFPGRGFAERDDADFMAVLCMRNGTLCGLHDALYLEVEPLSQCPERIRQGINLGRVIQNHDPLHALGSRVEPSGQLCGRDVLEKRKLPRLMDNPKVELSGIFPPGCSHEEVKVQRVADCCRSQAG